MTIEYGVNRPGGDYASFSVKAGPEECQSACSADAKCRAFTWVRAGTAGPAAGCWLKGSIPAGITDSAAVSGHLQGATPDEAQASVGSRNPVARGGRGVGGAQEATAERTIILEPGYDRPGYDYRHFAVQGDHSACQAACAAESQCKSFTWVKAGVQSPSASCWLKTDVPKAVPNANAVSGVVK
jgi:hypothetical protein